MKKFMISAAAVCFLVACGGGDTKQETTSGTTSTETAAPAEEKKADLSANPDYKAGLALIAKSDCLTCHKVSETSTGPAYKDVAKKYAGADEATIEKLANHIINGGAGNWGQVPMTPHPTVSLDDAKAMVKYVLLLNN